MKMTSLILISGLLLEIIELTEKISYITLYRSAIIESRYCLKCNKILSHTNCAFQLIYFSDNNNVAASCRVACHNAPVSHAGDQRIALWRKTFKYKVILDRYMYFIDCTAHSTLTRLKWRHMTYYDGLDLLFSDLFLHCERKYNYLQV